MKNQFSWEKYLSGQELSTRGNRKILYMGTCRNAYTDNCKCLYPILYVHKTDNGCISSKHVDNRGYHDIPNRPSEWDLILLPKTKELFMKVRKNSHKSLISDLEVHSTSSLHTKSEEVIDGRNPEYINVQLTFTDDMGELLNAEIVK